MLNNWHFFRFEIQLREEESSYQQQRRRLYQEIEAEKERCDQQLQQMKKEYDERRAAYEESSKQTVKVAQEDNQKQLQELKEKHQVSLLWHYPFLLVNFEQVNASWLFKIFSKKSPQPYSST